MNNATVVSLLVDFIVYAFFAFYLFDFTLHLLKKLCHEIQPN